MTMPSKDPAAVLDYLFEFTQWLTAGEVISSAVITASPVGINVGAPAPATTFTTTAVTFWLSGGTSGQTYLIGCRITTSAGRTDERSISVTVVDR